MMAPSIGNPEGHPAIQSREAGTARAGASQGTAERAGIFAKRSSNQKSPFASLLASMLGQPVQGGRAAAGGQGEASKACPLAGSRTGGQAKAATQTVAKRGEGAKKGDSLADENKRADGLGDRLAADTGTKAPRLDAALSREAEARNAANAAEGARSSFLKQAKPATGEKEDGSEPDAGDRTERNERRKRVSKEEGRIQGLALALPERGKPTMKTEAPSSEARPEAAAPAGSAKQDGRAKLQVIDLRKNAEAKAARDGARETAGVETPSSKESGSTKELVVDLRTPAAESGSERGGGAERAEAKPGLGGALYERLGESLNSDIVKTARIVLSEDGTGVIRLKLRPESLGEVKIELKLAENSIEGKIVVGSQEAKDAFERDLAALRDAFAREGFESPKLEVSIGSGGGPGREGGSDGDRPFWSERLRDEAGASRISAEAAERASAGAESRGRVDIVV